MKKIFMFTLILSLILCSFLGTVEKSNETLWGTAAGSHTEATWIANSDDLIPVAICRQRISVSEVFTRTISNLSWLGLLIRLIHIILFVCAAFVVRRTYYTNTSRQFIIRYIHDKDGHKSYAFC